MPLRAERVPFEVGVAQIEESPRDAPPKIPDDTSPKGITLRFWYVDHDAGGVQTEVPMAVMTLRQAEKLAGHLQGAIAHWKASETPS